MNEVHLMKGNEALAEAAIRAGCRGYFGYPITPQSEVIEYLSDEGRKRGMIVMQVESEVAAINMLYGAGGAGERVMTTSSSPGISLMQEGLSYIAAAEIPCVVANINRGGPGLGTIQPSQGDYFQAVKGGGHGDYHLVVLAPSSVQEMADFVYDAFDLSDKYRNPVLILSDGALGQMMEKVTFPNYDIEKHKIDKPWATRGKPVNGEQRILTSLHIKSESMEEINIKLQAKYKIIEEKEVRYQLVNGDDADILLVAYGLSARICHRAMDLARAKGVRVGMLRPITLYPYPYKILEQLSRKLKGVMVVEMSAGQMVEDVKLGVQCRIPVEFYGRMGGIIPSPEEIEQQLLEFGKRVGVKHPAKPVEKAAKAAKKQTKVKPQKKSRKK